MAADGRDAVACALNDRIHLRMDHEVVLERSFKSVRSILDAPGKTVESGGDDLLVRRDDDTADSAGWILAPSGD